MQVSIQADARRLPLFRGVREAALGQLLRGAYDQQFPSHVELIREGMPASFLHIVVEGQVELYANANGRDATMAVVRPVSTFILAAAVRDAHYLMSARTMTVSRIVMVPAEDVREVMMQDPAFARNVIEELAACYRGLVRHTKNLKLRNTRERIAAYLLRQSRVLGNVAGFTLSVEKRLLASYMGMTPENLSRALKSLAEDGCKIDGQRVIITDRARFEELAGLSPLLDGPDPEAVNAAVSLPLPSV
ncbi:MAG: cyclic nucleotide-binding domain-containing protein [Cypionkella sp.]|nr:cyclic nucleotide-binding domain-containing protein [Cypionkella sp.]